MSLKDKEMKNLFEDPKFARKAWKAVGHAILCNPATRLTEEYDEDGNPTLRTQIESYSYDSLARDIQQLGETNRKPTELEMILQCQIVKARYDTAAATFVRDTLGAKPVDETKLDATVTNPYESLSDEELELLARRREEQSLLAQGIQHSSSGAEPTTLPDGTIVGQMSIEDIVGTP